MAGRLIRPYGLHVCLIKCLHMKSEVFTIGVENDITAFHANIFGCQVGYLPIKYLGVSASLAAPKNTGIF
jgi:hypothetical protein